MDTAPEFVFIAHVVTESADHYLWPYSYEPTREEVIKRLFNYEGAAEIDWYEATTSVRIHKERITHLADKLFSLKN